MDQRTFGSSSLEVPAVGLGTWNVFNVPAERESRCHEVVETALTVGANLIDTSPMYGPAERIVGDALHGKRGRAIIATKVWAKNGEAEADRQIANALQYYDDFVDLYQVHNLVETEMVLRKLERLKEEGKVGLIGVTHYLESEYPQMMTWMRSGRIDAIQIHYNIERTEAASTVLPLAAELGLGVLVMSPLGSGSLVNLPVSRDRLAPFHEFGCTTWAQVLLKWILSDPRVHTVIPATSNPDRMRENAQAGTAPWFGDHERELVQRLASAAA